MKTKKTKKESLSPAAIIAVLFAVLAAAASILVPIATAKEVPPDQEI